MIGKWAKSEIDLHPQGRITYIVLTVVFFILSLPFDCHYSMLTNTYDNNIISFLFRSISSSFALICLSKAIKKSIIIEFIGKNSLIILCFHMFVIMAFGTLTKNYSCEYWLVPVCCSITILSMFIIVPLTRKIFPYIYQ